VLRQYGAARRDVALEQSLAAALHDSSARLAGSGRTPATPTTLARGGNALVRVCHDGRQRGLPLVSVAVRVGRGRGLCAGRRPIARPPRGTLGPRDGGYSGGGSVPRLPGHRERQARGDHYGVLLAHPRRDVIEWPWSWPAPQAWASPWLERNGAR
jgi:hypothetical protein